MLLDRSAVPLAIMEKIISIAHGMGKLYAIFPDQRFYDFVKSNLDVSYDKAFIEKLLMFFKNTKMFNHYEHHRDLFNFVTHKFLLVQGRERSKSYQFYLERIPSDIFYKPTIEELEFFSKSIILLDENSDHWNTLDLLFEKLRSDFGISLNLKPDVYRIINFWQIDDDFRYFYDWLTTHFDEEDSHKLKEIKQMFYDIYSNIRRSIFGGFTMNELEKIYTEQNNEFGLKTINYHKLLFDDAWENGWN